MRAGLPPLTGRADLPATAMRTLRNGDQLLVTKRAVPATIIAFGARIHAAQAQVLTFGMPTRRPGKEGSLFSDIDRRPGRPL